MAQIKELKDPRWSSAFTHIRISTGKKTKGQILKYKHNLLGWMGPKEAYILNTLGQHAKTIVKAGYETNFAMFKLLKPSGGEIGELLSISTDVVLIDGMITYAREAADKRGDPNLFIEEFGKLMFLACLPFGVPVLIVIIVAYQLGRFLSFTEAISAFAHGWWEKFLQIAPTGISLLGEQKPPPPGEECPPGYYWDRINKKCVPITLVG